MENYEKLKARMAEIGHIYKATAVLGWDQQCHMPPGGAAERAAEFSVLGKIGHEMFIGDETRALLEAAESETPDLAADTDEAAFLRVTRRDFDKAVKIPTSLVMELAETTALAYEVWVKARQDSDYTVFAPSLEKLLDLSRQTAECLGYDEHLYDALLDQYEPGMKTSEVRRVFAELKPDLVSLVRDIAAQPQIDDGVLRRDYDEAGQESFGKRIITRIGYDFSRGRQDRAVHPFCTSFGRDDVRITTRYDRHWLPCALMGSIHETGHALYDQGLDPKYDNTPLSEGTSLGVHESQSRLWENIVGRSRAFWDVYFPELRQQFPEALSDVTVDEFYRAINKVEPSLIRVEADEVTYNLHIMLRFEMELALLEGSLTVQEAPAAWNAKMEEYLGVRPANDAEGILQDVHWSGASFGYFPTYSIGTLLSAQFYETALKQNPAIADDLARGEFGSLLAWLRENVHRHGRRYLPSELVQRVCGEPAQSRSYMEYLNGKFRPIYGLD